MIFKEQHIGVGKLRHFPVAALRNLDSGDTVYVLGKYGEPLAVMMGYKLFMKMQEASDELRQEVDARGIRFKGSGR